MFIQLFYTLYLNRKEKNAKQMFMEMRSYTNVLHIVFELYLETLFSYELYSH